VGATWDLTRVLTSRCLVVTIPRIGVIGRAAYPDKGSVGLATHNPGGHVRFGVTATAASAVLYCAVVLLGVKAASPSLLDRGSDRDTSVVLIRPHDSAASATRQRLPQASPGRTRQQHRNAVTVRTPTLGAGSSASAPRPAAAPADVPARGAETTSQSSSRTETAVEEKPKPLLEVTPPTLPPPAPEIRLPTVSMPSLPVPLPETPTLLPAAPQVPELSDLPG
jgi:hypothetical protein